MANLMDDGKTLSGRPLVEGQELFGGFSMKVTHPSRLGETHPIAEAAQASAGLPPRSSMTGQAA